MRVKVKNTGSTVIAQGPGKYRIRNKTNGAAIFLSTAAIPETGVPTPAASEAEGYEWEKSSAGEDVIEVTLAVEQALVGIVKTGEAEQELHVLQTAPH